MSSSPSLRPSWFRTCLAAHRWTGLLATPFFFILCLTGSILIFHEEVDSLLGAAPPAAAAPAHPLGLSALEAAAVAQSPGKAVQLIATSPDTPDRAFIGIVPPGPSRIADASPLLLDRGTGKPLAFANPEGTFTGILLKLHSQWFAGVPGELLGSAIAILVFICLVTGIVIYAPYVKQMAFGVVRRGRGTRILQLDLHNLAGIVVLGWASVVTFTGICLGLGTILIGVWQNGELKTMAGGTRLERPAIIVSVDRAASAARAAMPDRDLQLAIYPGTDFSSPRHFTFFMYGRQSWNEHMFDIALVDAATGKIASAKPLPWYLKIVVMSEPLHFGNYGGLPLKLFWVVNAWGALFVTGNGAWLWWSRRRSKSRAAKLGEAATA